MSLDRFPSEYGLIDALYSAAKPRRDEPLPTSAQRTRRAVERVALSVEAVA